jgi:hypothetical protein
LTYPTELFAPVREGRWLALDNMPPQTEIKAAYDDLYGLLHGFDVLAMSGFVKYVPQSNHISGWMCYIDFATQKQAQSARRFDNSLIAGRRVRFSVTKPPLKHTLTWEGGRPSGHYVGERNGGSAVGTNFGHARNIIPKVDIRRQR